MAQRNFARGDAPPSHSWEWVGVPKPPTTSGKGTTAQRPGTPAPRPSAGPPQAAFVAVSETIVLRKKIPWWRYGIAGAVGFILGYKTGSY